MADDDRDEDYLHRQYSTDTEIDEFPSANGRKDFVGQPGLYVWLLTFAAGISGLLFGCKNTYLFGGPGGSIQAPCVSCCPAANGFLRFFV
jgi:hypothetical protein